MVGRLGSAKGASVEYVVFGAFWFQAPLRTLIFLAEISSGISNPPSKHEDTNSHEAMTDSFHVIPHSLFTNEPFGA
jgi:hypothetical protein